VYAEAQLTRRRRQADRAGQPCCESQCRLWCL